jgi:hypothetical protein
MSLVQLYAPTEIAHDTVAELAVLGNVQFKDVGPNELEDYHPSLNTFISSTRM